MLGLTTEQKDKMRGLFVDYSNATRKARMTLMALNDEKVTMVAGGKIDLKKLAEIDDRIVTARSEVLRERLKMKRERMALLTDDQIRRVGAFLARRGMRGSESGFGGGRGRRGPANWF
jgi:inactivated superfamily I helicase